MNTLVSPKFVSTALVAASIGLGALMTVSAPAAHADNRSDCQSRGGTYTETSVDYNGKPTTISRCCVTDVATKTTDCTTASVSKNVRIPVSVRPSVRPDVIAPAEVAEPAAPTAPIRRVPIEAWSTDTQIQAAP